MTIYKVSAQSQVVLFKESIQDSIELNHMKYELETIDETVTLKNLRVVNCQLDSILRDLTKEKSGKYVSYYYLALAKQDKKLYVEIMNIYSPNDLVDFSKKGVSSDVYLKKGSDILGCIVYNDSYFYAISFPIPNSVEKEDFNCLLDFTNKEIIIKKEKMEEPFFFIESPTWLYQYIDGKLDLLKYSVMEN